MNDPLDSLLGNKQPLVTVVMNCRNCEKYLAHALDSVVSQTFENWEIVFWDNQSTDKSASIFKSYNDERFRYFRAQHSSPLGQARNLAMEKARGEFIAFLDCDDLWLPKKLEKQISLFSDPVVGIVICDTIFFNDKKDVRQLYRRNKPPEGFVFSQLLGSYFISMETPVIRRSVLDGMDHWFDERFEVIEEYDFFVRLGRHWNLAYVDEVLAKWRIHESSWTWSRPELFPAETRLFLDKLEHNIPNFSSIYSNEIRSVMLKIAVQEALIAWGEGRSRSMREILKPYVCASRIARLLSLLSYFLPFAAFDLLNRFRLGRL